ncbi:ISC system 2Fe-2S type ferredoxin, partial [Providencia rettgeri]
MPKIVFLPHSDLCPDGAVVEAQEGESILNVALRSGIELEHACEKS